MWAWRRWRSRAAACSSAPAEHNGRAIAAQALRAGILLAPGEFFCLAPPDTAWFRFNVAYAGEPALLDFLRAVRRAVR